MEDNTERSIPADKALLHLNFANRRMLIAFTCQNI